MVTSKSRINAYVDDASYDAFKKWCNGHGCSDSKGVELLIKEYLLGVTQNQVTGNVPDNLVTQESFEAAIAEQNLQIKRLQGLIFNAPTIENERPFFTLDERVKYLEIELGELKKVKSFQAKSVSSSEQLPVKTVDKTIQSRLPITSDDILVLTELLDSHNAPKTNKTKNQDKTPITDTESLQSRFNDGMWLSTKEIIDLLSPTVKNLNKNTLNKRTMNEEKKIGEKRLTDIGIETYQDETTKHRFYRKIAIAE